MFASFFEETWPCVAGAQAQRPEGKAKPCKASTGSSGRLQKAEQGGEGRDRAGGGWRVKAFGHNLNLHSWPGHP